MWLIVMPALARVSKITKPLGGILKIVISARSIMNKIYNSHNKLDKG